MKKTILFFITILFGVTLAGESGDGLTPATAYYGTITTARTWTFAYNSGIIYVGQPGNEDLTITTGGSLTIEAGVSIIFCTTASDLKITGTGSLTAIGNSSIPITFTKLSSISSWGHLSFEGSTGTSQLTYCVIQNGSKSGIGVDGYGGGIYINSNTLTLTNCSIRNNYATNGGGIYVNRSSPHLVNCTINNNSTLGTGGGILFDLNCPSIVENCIIANNLSNGSGGGGGVFAGDNVGNLQFFNCDIVSNITTSNNGNNIRFYRNTVSPYPTFQNCIVWGSNNGIMFTNSPNPASTFVNCGLMGNVSDYTNCISLNAVNNDPAGPNFYNVTPGSEDYRITFISPCRDAGTTPSPPIPTDILGNPRVGPYDIGAYEVQNNNSSWTGATSSDWAVATNWNPNLVPLTTSHVIIPPASNNPAISFSDVTVNDILIESGASLSVTALRTLTAVTVTNSGAMSIINSGRFIVTSFLNEADFTVGPTSWATITTLTNNGTINLNSDNTGMFSLIFDTYSGTGTANIGMFLSGGGGTDNWRWHYVAVPAGYRNNKTMFTNINQYNLIQYDDSQIPDTPTATDNDGWVYHNGYMPGDPLGGPYRGQGFTDLYIGKGYGFYHSDVNGATVNFTGLSSLVNSLGSLTLQYNGDGKLVPGRYGFNLMGNSLTCGIDWNLVTSSGNVNNVIYYTINYKIGSYVRGAPSGINGAVQHIPPLQGFLVKANALGASLDFSSAREHTSQPRYKKSLEITGNDSKGDGSADPIIKLELNNSGNQDETLIWFNQNATKSFDGAYDGLKILSAGYDQIYSLSGSQKYGINAMPLPTETETISIAVKFLNSGSNYKIIASQLQGLENYNVTLTDKGNSNFITDLKNTGSYTFSSNAGTFPDRFVITIGTIATGVPDLIIPDKVFNVFAFDRTLNIEVLNDGWEGKKGTINLYNLTGIRVLQQNNIEWYKGDIKKIPLNLPQGIYIVEIKAENQKFVTKISIIK